ncbi:hypothetical protein Hypma_008603 [Hypsizygus marmoreus]|uniref:Uncharacterized protein n=1 Tax=Hypsizygus marmoreus TaxID=39966 RepID=A0A369JSA4_HYPMA|nr:hypothetical protein Hypma_008603 [Hypsizygus marmoreus]
MLSTPHAAQHARYKAYGWTTMDYLLYVILTHAQLFRAVGYSMLVRLLSYGSTGVKIVGAKDVQAVDPEVAMTCMECCWLDGEMNTDGMLEKTKK